MATAGHFDLGDTSENTGDSGNFSWPCLCRLRPSESSVDGHHGMALRRKNMSRRSLMLFALGLTMVAGSANAATDKVLNFALQQEPPQLNSMKATDQQSFFVIGHVMEGLVDFGKKIGEYVPGVAES